MDLIRQSIIRFSPDSRETFLEISSGNTSHEGMAQKLNGFAHFQCAATAAKIMSSL